MVCGGGANVDHFRMEVEFVHEVGLSRARENLAISWFK